MSHNPQLDMYRSLYPKAGVITTDFSKLEKHVMDQIMNHPNAAQAFKDAVTYGGSMTYHTFGPSKNIPWSHWYKHGIDVMPRTLFSFHPARNNQIVRTNVQTVAQLQEALDDNPDFTHISVVNDGKHWLIHKGHVNGQSSIRQGKWKPISFNRLPKPIKMLLVIQPLGE